MLTNPIRGKAGKQIVAISSTAPAVLYIVPVGKYFELASMPAGITFTANGVTSANTASTTLMALPMVLQAGTVITAQANNLLFVGTEYDA